MLKIIFELIKQPLGLPINVIYEYIILIILNEIAFRIAWDASPGGRWGSLIHWIVRIPTFLVIWFTAYCAIVIGKWIIINWLTIVIVSILSGILIGFIKYTLYQKRINGN